MQFDTPRVRSRLDLLYLVTREFGARLEIDQVLQRVLSATVASVSAYNASLFLLDQAGKIENLFFIQENFEVQQRSRPGLAAIMEHGLVGWIIKHREDVLVKDTQTDERWYKNGNPELTHTRSVIGVPIQLPEQFIGVLMVTATQPNYFDESDLAMLRIIADQAAFAIANARLFKAEQRRHRLADTLTSVARTINSTLDLKEVLYLILEQLALVIDYNSSAILLLEDNVLSVRAARGFEDMKDALNVTVSLEEGQPNYRAVVQKRPLLINDVDLEPGWKKSSSSQKVRSWIGAPLIAQDEVIGMLTVDSYEVDKYTEENVLEVAAFADQAATAVANAQAVALLRSMEESYTDLFEDSADMIVITNYQGLILDANRKTCEMLRRPKEAIVGSDISFIDRHLKDCLTEKTNRLRTWREVSLELDILDAYRDKVSLEINARQVRYAGKACVQWVGRDISTRKEAERMRQDLINMLVHDLRGPVGNLINMIELLPMLITSIDENPRLGNFLTLARRSGQEVRDLVDSMLDVGRLETGEIHLQRSVVDLEEIIQAVKDQVTPHAETKGMELIFNPLPDDIPEVWIDRGMIRRILINLVDNAIKYTPYEGQVSLTTTLNGETLCFAVKDNGPGISKANQTRIFNKFSRVDNSANAPSGVGLGLAFCKLAAEAHGGSISVESEGIPGQGSTFYLALPLLTPSEE
ncbi:MAG: GAF domain-containing protein [Anaerolineae bacterium]|nr:GAF domain-containing protein [Anaerolineae bacterium]